MTSFDDATEPPVATRAGEGSASRGRVPPTRPGPASGRRWRTRRAQAVTLLRRHWLVSALLAAGLVLRVLAQVAYRPALLYVDTLKYLYGASPGSDPLGYRWC